MKGILIFLVVFGILVFVHEFGHFIVAKKCGILVREFSIVWDQNYFKRCVRKPHIPLDGYL